MLKDERRNVLGQRVHGPELADFSVVEVCPLGELCQEPRYKLADGSGDVGLLGTLRHRASETRQKSR